MGIFSHSSLRYLSRSVRLDVECRGHVEVMALDGPLKDILKITQDLMIFLKYVSVFFIQNFIQVFIHPDKASSNGQVISSA